MAKKTEPTLDPRITDPKCVYAERVKGITPRKGAEVYFLYWWDYHQEDKFDPHGGQMWWKGQIFHTETPAATAAADLAKKRGVPRSEVLE